LKCAASGQQRAADRKPRAKNKDKNKIQRFSDGKSADRKDLKFAHGQQEAADRGQMKE